MVWRLSAALLALLFSAASATAADRASGTFSVNRRDASIRYVYASAAGVRTRIVLSDTALTSAQRGTLTKNSLLNLTKSKGLHAIEILLPPGGGNPETVVLYHPALYDRWIQTAGSLATLTSTHIDAGRIEAKLIAAPDYRLNGDIVRIDVRFSLQKPIDVPNNWVTDRAGVLSSADLRQLTEKLQRIDESGIAQAIVYIEPSAGGRKIETHTRALMNEWGIAHGDGIGIFVFIDDAAMRIEVGEGIEKKLPNALTQKAIDEDMVPAFQARRFAQGLSAAVDRLVDALKEK